MSVSSEARAVNRGLEQPRRSYRRWLRRVAVGAVLALFAVELVVGWKSLSAALAQLKAPRPGWLVVAMFAELAEGWGGRRCDLGQGDGLRPRRSIVSLTL